MNEMKNEIRKNDPNTQTVRTHRKPFLVRQDGLSVEELRCLLFGVGDQASKVHVVTEEKYGEIRTTKSVQGLRFEIDDDGNQHIIINTL